LANDAAPCRHLHLTKSCGDAELIHHWPVDVPSMADGVEAKALQSALTIDRERLMPIGHRYGERQTVEAIEADKALQGGNLLDSVIEAGHGLKEVVKALAPRLKQQ